MVRFLALLWNQGDTDAALLVRHACQRYRHRYQESRTIVENRNFIVVGTGDSALAQCFPQDNGAVLGRVFGPSTQESTIQVNARLDADELNTVVRTRGKHLIEKYWGHYIALIRDPLSERAFVVRDPTGGLPCLITHHRRITLCASDFESFDCIGMTCEINWRFVRILACQPIARPTATGVLNIEEVGAGECRALKPGSVESVERYWHASHFAARSVDTPVDEAARAVSTVTRACVAAWSSQHPRVLHRLSGGLDSSVVLRCLRDAPTGPEVTCVNYYDPNSSWADERTYARQTAQSLNVELIESENLAVEARLHEVPKLRVTAKPETPIYGLWVAEFESRLAAERRATALFSGHGGDQIFFKAPVLLTVVDAFDRWGFAKRFWKHATDLSRVQQVSMWRILKLISESRKAAKKASTLDRLPVRRSRLLSKEVSESARDDSYLELPWLGDCSGLSLAKRMHAKDSPLPLEVVSASAITADMVHPLMSQPLIELCLALITPLLTFGGIDRALERRGFETALPDAITGRSSKGVTDQSLFRYFLTNRSFLRELFLDGELVKRNMLDRHTVEQLFEVNGIGYDREVCELVSFHIDLEVWLQNMMRVSRTSLTTDSYGNSRQVSVSGDFEAGLGRRDASSLGVF